MQILVYFAENLLNFRYLSVELDVLLLPGSVFPVRGVSDRILPVTFYSEFLCFFYLVMSFKGGALM